MLAEKDWSSFIAAHEATARAFYEDLIHAPLPVDLAGLQGLLVIAKGRLTSALAEQSYNANVRYNVYHSDAQESQKHAYDKIVGFDNLAVETLRAFISGIEAAIADRGVLETTVYDQTVLDLIAAGVDPELAHIRAKLAAAGYVPGLSDDDSGGNGDLSSIVMIIAIAGAAWLVVKQVMKK